MREKNREEKKNERKGKERKERKKERKERRKEGKERRREGGMVAGHDRWSPAVARGGWRRLKVAGGGRPRSQAQAKEGCKCSSFGKFGVLKMVFWRTKLYLKSTPRRRGWRDWWWLRWCRWW